jgi:hypothetical protein
MKFDGRTIVFQNFFDFDSSFFYPPRPDISSYFNDPRCKYVTLHVNGNARTDGVGVSSGGRDVNTRCPLARPST